MITIFTDGSARGNPGPGGWGAVIVSGSRVTEIGGAEKHTTNNKMELIAAIGAFFWLENEGVFKNDSETAIIINTDSAYAVNGITKWIFGWQKSGWITKGKEEVQNRVLWEQLYELSAGRQIEWKLVSGHVGVAGNERADKIATEFADGKKPALFSGTRKDYEKKYKINIENIAHDAKKKFAKSKNSSHSRAVAYSYVSMVKGVIKTQKTWVECEKRVKGVSGAKFKKATSPSEEKELIAEWKNLQEKK